MNICKPIINKPIWRPARLITYLHSGPRIRGIKRDPESYLKNPKGLSYNNIKSDEYQQTIRKALNLEKYDINMSDDLLLQCLTHKSFAHGSKPYNEKLSLLGSQFLKYQASIYSINQKDTTKKDSTNIIENDINGLDFTNLGTSFSKLLISTAVLSKFVKEKKLNSLIFWKMRDNLKIDMKGSGEPLVCSTVLNALIGGMLSTNGIQKTKNFIEKELLNRENDISLIKLANAHSEKHQL
ncbi:hypothetical protein TPHA_0K02040 [Tetrapisispora phaffii CBS 4417]|uniref:RNase III domain-containing protein n=1 Tax=Tetrapisispora phaffii (strain ATCC 24235 / CBS 4417 / NBRC 1672 / NRRL Y-8282 / UCD 70-5) TaxID=1071381 RepID=G8BZK9_TETPH|nr:mitochondrial 54S ribosomal protein YmL15 TPHA_0K02040 [Tetrapisispora phaffii CBS 4417]CCE65337.1 hypothetical protein TPHA_0K02040 [Tetrapisispora phaffii CBS 4417]